VDKDDRHHNLLKLLEENISFNFMGPSNRPPGVGTGRVGVVEFKWDEDAAREMVKKWGYFDFLICADCVYQPVYGKSWQDLAACFNILCGPSTDCYISVHRRTEDNVEAFLDLLVNEYRFMLSKKSTQYSVPAGTATIEIYTLRRVSETSERFLIDVHSSATQIPSEDVIQAWRGPMPTRWIDWP